MVSGTGKDKSQNNKSTFSTSTRQGLEEESDSIKRLTHGEVLCTTDIRIDVEDNKDVGRGVDGDRKGATYVYS